MIDVEIVGNVLCMSCDAMIVVRKLSQETVFDMRARTQAGPLNTRIPENSINS